MQFKRLCTLLFLLIGLPLLGVWISGTPFHEAFLYIPQAIFIESTDSLPTYEFSWTYTLILSILAAAIFPLFSLFLYRNIKQYGLQAPDPTNFPWWGWFSIVSLFFFWTVAWTRPPQFSYLNQLSFTLLWCSYIILLNALTYMRSGKCMLTNQSGYLVTLFIVSIPFWWYFEYLNRFTLNWYYLVPDATQKTSLSFLISGSIAFSTVLPAVISAKDFFLTFPFISQSLQFKSRYHIGKPKRIALICLIASSILLMGIGIWPHYLYPFLWISPLFIFISLQTLWGEKQIFSQGNWSVIIAAIFAGVLCGFTWEIWNILSMPKWLYSVPFVSQVSLFEMPILGYLGYIPFGLECLAIAEWIRQK